MWQSLENSPLTKALTEPLPFELPPGQRPGEDDDYDDDPGLWYRGMDWLDQLHQTRTLQRHLAKYSPQGDMLFYDEYIANVIEREEREWREWNRHTTAGRTTAAVGSTAEEDDDDDDDSDQADMDEEMAANYQYEQSHSRGSDYGTHSTTSSYAAAVDSATKHSAAGTLSAAHAHQDLMYDESGEAFEMQNAYYGYQPQSSRYDPITGRMITSSAADEPVANIRGAHTYPSSGGTTSPSSSPNHLSAFHSHEGFGAP